MIRVSVDTREQTPYEFKTMRLTKIALSEGDYALGGDKFGLVIERKSIEDLFGTLSKDAVRFEKELERLAPYAYPVVLVEGMPSRILLGAHYSGANGDRVLRHLFELCVKHHVCLMFADGRYLAQDMARRLLEARHKAKHAKTARLA